MHISEKAINLIKNFEGLRTKSYICPAGVRTIGYGHVLAANDNRNNISEKEAEKLLRQDVAKSETSVLRNVVVSLTQGQFDALVSFTYNLGNAALQRSTLRQKINRHEHEEVPKELRRWVYAGGRVLLGLVKRREAEAEIYLS